MSELLDTMVDAALCAGAAILDIYETNFDVEIKNDDSPVTKADQSAEAIILEQLKAATDIPIVAEESVAAGVIPDVGRQFFLVDPLDGTKEFVNRNGEFTVNIALIRNHTPVLGVIFAPVKGWLFVGDVRKEAWRADVSNVRTAHDLEHKRTIKVRDAGDLMDIIGSRSHHTPEAEAYLQAFKIGDHKSIGSSLKFCLLAAGEADLYPRFGRTMEWDTAAGDAILSAAGGTVVTVDGKRLQYGKIVQEDAPFANPYFIACRV